MIDHACFSRYPFVAVGNTTYSRIGPSSYTHPTNSHQSLVYRPQHSLSKLTKENARRHRFYPYYLPTPENLQRTSSRPITTTDLTNSAVICRLTRRFYIRTCSQTIFRKKLHFVEILYFITNSTIIHKSCSFKL